MSGRLIIPNDALRAIISKQVKQPEFLLPRNFSPNDTESMYQAYHTEMVNMTEMYGAELDSSAVQEIADLLTLEYNLSNVCICIFNFPLMIPSDASAIDNFTA